MILHMLKERSNLKAHCNSLKIAISLVTLSYLHISFEKVVVERK